MEDSCPVDNWDNLKHYAQHTWKRLNLMANYTDDDAEEMQEEYGMSMDKFLEALGLSLDQYKAIEKKVISTINKTAQETNVEDWRLWGMMRVWENVMDNVGMERSLERPVIRTVSKMWKVEPKATYKLVSNHIFSKDPNFIENMGIDLEKFIEDTEEYRWKMDL